MLTVRRTLISKLGPKQLLCINVANFGHIGLKPQIYSDVADMLQEVLRTSGNWYKSKTILQEKKSDFKIASLSEMFQ
jgi:hypothetical protein